MIYLLVHTMMPEKYAAAIMAGDNPSFAASPPKFKPPEAACEPNKQIEPVTALPSVPTETEMEPVARGDRVISMFYQRDGEHFVVTSPAWTAAHARVQIHACKT